MVTEALGRWTEDSRDSRRGDPTWPVEVGSPSFCCLCLAKRPANLEGLDAIGEPTLLELALGMPLGAAISLGWLSSCSDRDVLRAFSCGVNTSS